MADSDFFTLKGYSMQEQGEISHSMEDYLEMIYRHIKDGHYIRITQLASLLHVRPPSASKMAAKLRQSGMIAFEPYGMIQLTARGKKFGAYLLYRHNILNQLFCTINHTENEVKLVEKIEHHFDEARIKNIEVFLKELKENEKFKQPEQKST